MKNRKRSASLDALIRALCADYERRKECIKADGASRRVLMEYVFLNSKILEGAAEICGESLAEPFVLEIGSGTGYAGSALMCMCELTYKKYKKAILHSIACKLHLSDL